MDREAIFVALADLLNGIPGVVTFSRKLLHWTDVSPSQQPALFLAQGNQTATPGDPARGLPTKWTLSADLYLYTNTQGETSPSTRANILLDAIEHQLSPPPLQRTQTLGGLVEHCWIEGAIETDEGTLGDQAVAIVPLKILITA